MKSHALKSTKSKRIKTEVETPKSVSVNKRSNYKKFIKPENSNEKDGSFSPCPNEEKLEDEPSELIKEIRKTFEEKINELNKKYFNYNHDEKEFSSLPNLEKSELFTELESEQDLFNRESLKFSKKQFNEEFPPEDTKVIKENVKNERFSINYSKILDIYESCKSQERLISKKLENMSRIYEEYQNELDQKFQEIKNEIEIIQSKASQFLEEEKQKHLTECKIQSRVYKFIGMVKKVKQLYIKKEGEKRIKNHVINEKGEMICCFGTEDEMKKVLGLNETGSELIKTVKKIENELGSKYEKVNKIVSTIKEFFKNFEDDGLFGEIRLEENRNILIKKIETEIENKIEEKESLLIEEEKYEDDKVFNLDEGIISLENLIEPYVETKEEKYCCKVEEKSSCQVEEENSCKQEEEENEFLENIVVLKGVKNNLVEKVIENSENSENKVDKVENKNEEKTIEHRTNENNVEIRDEMKENTNDNEKFNIQEVFEKSKYQEETENKNEKINKRKSQEEKISDTNNDKFEIKELNQNYKNETNNENNKTNLLDQNKEIFELTLKDAELKSKTNHYETQEITQEHNQLLESPPITLPKPIYTEVEENENIYQNKNNEEKVQEHQQNCEHSQESPIQQSKSEHILSPNIKFNLHNIKKPETFIDILPLSKTENDLETHLQNHFKEQNLETLLNPTLSKSQLNEEINQSSLEEDKKSQLEITPQKEKEKISNSKKSIKKLNSILKNNIHHNETINEIHQNNLISLSHSQNNSSFIKNQTENEPTFKTLNQKSTQRLRSYRKTNPYSLFYSSIEEITKKVSFNSKEQNEKNFKDIQIKDEKKKLNESYLFRSYKSLEELPLYLKEINEQKTIFNPQSNSLPYSLNLRINEENSKHQQSNRQVSINHLSSSRNTLKNVCFDNLRKQKLKFDQMKSCILPEETIQRINN